MAQTITIETPPTFFVASRPNLVFDLPLVPRLKLQAGALWLFGVLGFGAFAFWTFLALPASLFLLLLTTEMGFRLDVLASALFVSAFGILAFAPFVELARWVGMTVLSRQPVLEIRPEGLIDRRVLRRTVRWDEFESVGDAQHVRSHMGRAVEISFRLKDASVRRFSPISVLQSVMFGGKRVAILPYGFDAPPRVILDVILAMIRKAHSDTRAA
jgi:hypothetical protein